MVSTITSKGQITIPKSARDAMKVGPGDKVKFFLDSRGRLTILPVLPIEALKGIVKSRLGRPVTLVEMRQAPEAGAVERYERAIGKR
jgi:antitoxin PrlF